VAYLSSGTRASITSASSRLAINLRCLILRRRGRCGQPLGGQIGSPVSLDYYDKVPFKFNGTIEQVHVEYMVTKK
jgi:hypothetical protein